MGDRIFKLIVFFSTFSLFSAYNEDPHFEITNTTAAIVSVWIAKTHESVTRPYITEWWLNEDEFSGLGAIRSNESQDFYFPWVSPYGKPWKSFFIRYEEEAPLAYPVLGDPRYAHQQAMQQSEDPEPIRTFKRNRAITFNLGNYKVTENPIDFKAENTSPDFPEYPCRLYVKPTLQGFLPKGNYDHQDDAMDIDFFDEGPIR